MPDTLLKLPLLLVEVGGRPLSEGAARCFTSLQVHLHLCRPAACELVFRNLDDADFEALSTPGTTLHVALRQGSQTLFDGVVSAVETAWTGERVHEVAVRAYDRLLALRNRDATRALAQLTAADVARELVADLGLEVACDEPGPRWPRLLQTGSDFDLLADVCARCGLYFSLSERRLHLDTLAGRAGASPDLRLHDNLLEARFEANAHGTSARVAARGWDPWLGLEHEAQALRARRTPDSHPRHAAADIGGNDDGLLAGHSAQGQAQAAALAQAELDARAARSLVFQGTALGDARWLPGLRVTVRGVPARLAGPHVLASVCHTMDAERGFVTELGTALPAAAPRPSGAAMTLGHVTRIDDPDRLGRVQVAMPAYGDIESDWLQVLAAGAGQGKGLVAQPDIGDRVVLLIDRADPAQAVVLGSLWAQAGLPEEQGGLGSGASYCLITPGGHRLRLDDGQRALRITGSAGSSLEFTPDRVTLHAQAPLTIEAPGQRMTIRARYIDFDRG